MPKDLIKQLSKSDLKAENIINKIKSELELIESLVSENDKYLFNQYKSEVLSAVSKAYLVKQPYDPYYGLSSKHRRRLMQEKVEWSHDCSLDEKYLDKNIY